MSMPLTRVCAAEVRKCIFTSLQYRGFKRHLAPTLKTLKMKKENMDPQPPIHRSSLIEWNYKAELFAFSKRLGEDFDSSLLQQAFTTREYIIDEIEKQKAVGIEQPEIELNDNRSMIESGDKIINNYVLRYLRTVFPKLPEEGIYTIKEYLTSNIQLATIATNIGISDLILVPEMPPDEETTANAFKALVASLFESSGLDQSNLFIRDFVITQLVGKNVNDIWKISNPKELLSDILERDGKPSVEYRLIGEAGKSTILAAYQVGVYLNKQYIGAGFGESIPVAIEMAALDVLRQLFNITDTTRPIPFDLKLKADSSEPFANISVKDWCEKNIDKLNVKSS